MRVMLKLSGEVLAGPGSIGFDQKVLKAVATQLLEGQRGGSQIAVVLGGGNLFRGLGAADEGVDRVTGDQMGMLATIMNGLALQNAIRSLAGKAQVFTAFPLGPVGEAYSRDRAASALDDGQIVILAGGTGNPFFSTDSAAALRAAELGCQIFYKGTKVDGVYDKDPVKHKDAQRFDRLTFDEMLDRKLGVIDLTAATLCRENKIQLRVYDMTVPGIIGRAAGGEALGTLVTF